MDEKGLCVRQSALIGRFVWNIGIWDLCATVGNWYSWR